MTAAMTQAMQVLTSQRSQEWYTPPAIIERARCVLGAIDLDPASNDFAQQWIQAATYYTAMTPLQAPWYGRVWLNPPFDDTPTWVARLTAAYGCGDVTAALLLVNSAPGYTWWEALWRDRPVCMVRERLRFVRPDGTTAGQAKKGQTIAYFGMQYQRFTDHFRDLGRIIYP